MIWAYPFFCGFSSYGFQTEGHLWHHPPVFRGQTESPRDVPAPCNSFLSESELKSRCHLSSTLLTDVSSCIHIFLLHFKRNSRYKLQREKTSYMLYVSLHRLASSRGVRNGFLPLFGWFIASRPWDLYLLASVLFSGREKTALQFSDAPLAGELSFSLSNLYLDFPLDTGKKKNHTNISSPWTLFEVQRSI